jgi:hypothetical protein
MVVEEPSRPGANDVYNVSKGGPRFWRVRLNETRASATVRARTAERETIGAPGASARPVAAILEHAGAAPDCGYAGQTA